MKKKEYKLLQLEDVMAMVGMSRSGLYQIMNKGQFPRPIKIGDRRTGWLKSDIDDWFEERIKARDTGADRESYVKPKTVGRPKGRKNKKSK